MLSESQERLILKPNSLFAKRYRVVRSIDSGTMGTVFQVKDEALDGEEIALKLLRPTFVDDEVFFERFRNEVRLCRKLNHPNVIRIHDLGEDEIGRVFFTMEYVEGQSLADRIHCEEQRPISVDEAVRILHGICNGIAAAHHQGTIHRDLKPANILLAKSGMIKIADFGLAHSRNNGKDLTQHGEALGTPYYMSPENIRGYKLDRRTDIYALGIIAYEMLSKTRPFEGENWYELADKHMKAPFPAIECEHEEVPHWYQEFAARCAAKHKEARYHSAEEAARSLEELSTRAGNARVHDLSEVSLDLISDEVEDSITVEDLEEFHQEPLLPMDDSMSASAVSVPRKRRFSVNRFGNHYFSKPFIYNSAFVMIFAFVAAMGFSDTLPQATRRGITKLRLSTVAYVEEGLAKFNLGKASPKLQKKELWACVKKNSVIYTTDPSQKSGMVCMPKAQYLAQKKNKN